ncbi:hypothetical protein PM3016_1985 [Paenibacillus mucilaginosus 3016]|uniref:Uncharacterized protein n=1 Tax=Paenibacillus mucilaginosus 3016 TaxID=1116391 RepID=H6NA43_9BACL|nr:hypothetical protein PM3016_1985 [Paenibacillus mucilaginosus 3016]
MKKEGKREPLDIKKGKLLAVRCRVTGAGWLEAFYIGRGEKPKLGVEPAQMVQGAERKITVIILQGSDIGGAA